jgi:multimeric flavodoxin WrbA
VATFVLAIAGGTRPGGNSELLLDRAIQGATAVGGNVEKVRLLDRQISPCICPHSEDCLPTGVCTVLDDMQELYQKLRAADVVFLAFPITFRGVPAQTKTMFDRTQALWAMKYRLGRAVRRTSGTGSSLVIATADRDDPHEFEGAMQATRSWLVSFDFKEQHRLLFNGLVRPRDVDLHPEYLEESYLAGRRFVLRAESQIA